MYDLTSGKKKRDADLLKIVNDRLREAGRLTGTATSGRASDVEQKFAAIMIRDGINSAVVVINNPNGPCSVELGCDDVLNTLLGDRQLTVYYPDGNGRLDVATIWRSQVILHRLEARYRREHTREPVVLNTPDDVDALVDALLAAPKSHNMAQLHSAERPLLPSGYHDHELLAGVDGELQVGVLAFMDMSAEQGNVVTLSSSEGRGEVSYSIAGAATEFPDRSEVPIDLVRQAIKEFLLSGGKRPRCVEWQVPEIW